VNIEEELRKAFQAGQNHGAVVYGEAEPVSGETPLDEDAYIKKAMYGLSLQRIVELVDGKQEPTVDDIVRLGKEAMKRNHPEMYAELVEAGEIDG
jgi:hypothetical protein